jgi:hypothetical protein
VGGKTAQAPSILKIKNKSERHRFVELSGRFRSCREKSGKPAAYNRPMG